MKIIKLLIIIICFASNSTAQTSPAEPSTIELTSTDHGLAKEIEILHQQITTEEGLNSTKLFTKNENTQIMCLHNKGSLTFNNMANLLSSIEVENGVIHIIDNLLLPVF